jgi:carbonic anhydrase
MCQTLAELGPKEIEMDSCLSRRGFLASAGLGVAAAVADPAAIPASASPPEPTPRQALKMLQAGNRRWVTGRVTHPHQSIARRLALRRVQNPFATVFSCIDSRVPPELVFDTGIGDLAVIRTGAQVLDEGVVFGSIEFTPDHLGSPLILVMGHQRCGAVQSAAHLIHDGGTAPGHIQSIVDALRRAYDIAIEQPGDLVDNMVRAQTKLTVGRLRRDPLLQEFIHEGKLGIAGAYYSLDTGVASIIA